jgi:hypothetical protein
MSASDDQTRIDILELLYRRTKDPGSSKVDRAIIAATLGLPEKNMDVNMLHLEEKALVSLSRSGGRPQWTFAKITEDGVRVMENKERYAEKFPFTQVKTSLAPEAGKESAAEIAPDLSPTEQVADSFNQAYNQIRDANISDNERKKLEKELNNLEKELRKERIDLGSIQKQWEWLRKNANWLCPVVAPLVLEEIKKALDLKE